MGKLVSTDGFLERNNGFKICSEQEEHMFEEQS